MNNKKLNFHGITSMLLFIVSAGIADYALFNYSKSLGLIYLMVIILAFSFIALTYCTKCPIRERCNHLIPGFVSKLRQYNSSSYTNLDIVSTLLAVLVIITLPQYWMFESFYLFLIYWILMIVVGIEIIFFVCSKCGNKKCALCRVDCKKKD